MHGHRNLKLVPRVLTVEQKQQRLSISLELRDRAASENSFLGNVITGDKTWIYGYDPETRVLNGNHPVLLVRKKKRVNQDPASRWWWLFFFYLDGIVRAEFVSRNTTVNSEYYKGLLERLRNNMRGKRPEKWANSFILHHDNTLCHTSLLVRQFLSKILRYVLMHRIHRIWHRATSGSSPKSKWPWKVNVLNRFRTSRQAQQGN